MTLDDRARRAALAVLERADHADADAVLSRIERRGRRRWAWPVAGVATVVAVVVAVALAVPSLPRPAIDQITPEPSGQPDEPSVPVGGFPEGWDRIDLGTGGLWQVASGPAGLVAVGAIDREPGVAVSADGRDWTTHAGALPDAQTVLAIAADDAGYVAVGEARGAPALWTSSDGRTWRRADIDLPDSGSLTGVAHGHGEWVAVGHITRGGLAEPLVLSPAPGDRSTWLADVADAATVLLGDDIDRTMTNVAAAGRGFVATGTGGDLVTLWHNLDGAWEVEILSGEPGFPVPMTIPRPVGLDGRMHLVGSTGEVGQNAGAIWAADGDGGWSRGTGDVAAPTGQIVEHAVAGPDGHYAAGYRTADGGMRPAVWRQTDAGSWEQVDGGDAFADSGWIAALLRTPDGLVAVGGTPEHGAVVWTYGHRVGEAAPTPSPQAPGDGPCSSEPLRGTPATDPEGLPVAVADLRLRIAFAARDCDLDALAALADPDRFTYSFGGADDPAGFWRRSETAGDRPMWWLVGILDQPWATVDGLPDDDPADRLYVWPAAATSTNEEDWRTLVDAGIATEDDLAAWRAYGDYTGFRVGLTDDGRWRYFVAGD